MATGAKTRKMIYELPLEELSPDMRAKVRSLLILVVNFSEDGQSSQIARAAMAKALGCSTKTVSRRIAAAEDLGLLVVDEIVTTRGQQASRYTLSLMGVSNKVSTTGKKCPGGGTKCPGALDKVSRGGGQSVQPYKRITISSSTSPSSSSPPLPPTPVQPLSPQPPAGVRCRVWESALTELEALGLSGARSALQIVRDRRHLNPQGVSEIIAHYRAHQGAWQPGGLYQRLVSGTKDQRPDEGWPPMSIAYQRSQRSKSIKAQQEFSRQETLKRKVEDQERIKTIRREKAEYGLRRKRYLEPFLGLPDDEQEVIVKEALEENRFLWDRYRKSGLEPIIEREVVGYLEENQIRLSS